ncbi:DUF1211 domain-containing protein [Lactobacillus sp. CC-MHH1034]|uniref:TMEM175 family protein n=1 Tax=Agrilactobacillus fermenti TaxID=2586909 RepID=UPI001E35A7B0|nr:TMEM175 family protein [Agrilactobacillus fermenti]MCD2255155.1 DUF1211 domain-containing protein [Agrilactobacillus fermenti]
MFKNKISRLEAISDGIFAIVLTIMVLDIKTPNNLDFTHLHNLPTDIILYFISFSIVGQYWVYHQEVTGVITKPTIGYLILNLTYLCFVCLTPFATGLLNNDLTSRFNALIFSTVIFAVDLTQYLIFRYVINYAQAQRLPLTNHDFEEKRATLIMTILAVIYILVALIYPILLLVVIFLGFLVRSLISHWMRAHQQPSNQD